ncbi:MAG: glycosyl hydrolase 53 family protein [Gammaproteobacteria bacterium]|nr:glycosyl hydrolase 53 family protein [Gammaproteobacteria bacterium]
MPFTRSYPVSIAGFVRIAFVVFLLFTLIRVVQGAPSVDDNFDGDALNWCKWEDVSFKGVVNQEAGELRLATVGADKFFESAKVLTQYQVTGDFDVQVDYRRSTGFAEALPVVPDQFPQLIVALGLYWDEARYIQFSRAKNIDSEVLSVYASLPELTGKPMPYLLSSASAGTLRMVRTGSRVTFLHSTGRGWTELGTIDTPATPAHLYLNVATINVQRAVTAQMDNFRLNSGTTDDIDYVQPTSFHKRNDFAVGGVFETYPARRFWGNAYATVDPFKLFRENGMTWARVSVTTVSAPELASTPPERWNTLGWQNHFWSSREYAIASLKAAAAQGMRLYANLFFSHEAAHWGNQKAPPEWAGKSVAETAALMEQYAYEIAQYFQQQGLNVEVYEIGNEIDIGMVDFLPSRRIAVPAGVNIVGDYTWLRNNVWNIEATLLKAGITGIRRANPAAKTAVHIAGLEIGPGPEFAAQFFQAMHDFGVNYDYAALSHPYAYYPWKLNRYSTVCWFKRVARTVSQIAALGTPVMIVEAAYQSNPVQTVDGPMLDFPFTPAGQADWLREQLRFASALPSMAGWFYFYPEIFSGWLPATDPAYRLEWGSLLAADGVARPALAELRVNLETPPTPNDNIILALEEPANDSIYSGVSNVRGWAVAPQGLQKIELYVDSAFQGNIPLGGKRTDVGAQYPTYPGSADSGFAMALNYSNLTAGSHTLTVRAFDTGGGARDASAAFTVARFANSYMGDPAAVNVDQTTLTRSGNVINIQDLQAEGKTYNVRLDWRPAAQGFAITQIDAN